MYVKLLLISFVATTFHLGCRGAMPPVDSKLLDPAGTFTLHVSNQSFAVSPVDITVKIDGETVVSEYFSVGNQHNWRTYTLNLPSGRHTVSVASQRGQAAFTETFTVSGPHWAVINYWYYPDGSDGTEPTPRSFTFSIQDGPIGFA